MSWLCENCGEELKMDPMAFNDRRASLPKPWVSAMICLERDKGSWGTCISWGHVIRHSPCWSEEADGTTGDAVWVDHPTQKEEQA